MNLPLIAAGREADVYALDDHRVLRRYRGTQDGTAEVAVMTHLAGHGFPVPRVYETAGPDLIMQRLTGPTLLAQLLGGQAAADGAAALLADLHTRLHALPPLRPAPGASILHLDLHPDNIMMTAGGPVLIDWSSASDGPPDLDLAVTAMILGEVAAGLRGDELAGPARQLLRAFLRRVDGDPFAQLDRAAELRSAIPLLTPTERDGLPAAVRQVHEAAG